MWQTTRMEHPTGKISIIGPKTWHIPLASSQVMHLCPNLKKQKGVLTRIRILALVHISHIAWHFPLFSFPRPNLKKSKCQKEDVCQDKDVGSDPEFPFSFCPLSSRGPYKSSLQKPKRSVLPGPTRLSDLPWGSLYHLLQEGLQQLPLPSTGPPAAEKPTTVPA